MTTSILECFAHLLHISRLLPTRRIVTRGGARVRGIVPSKRFAKEMHWEADLERRLLYRLEGSQRVTDAYTQPLTVSIPSVGGQFRLHAGCPRRRQFGTAGLCRMQATHRVAKPAASRAPGSHRPTPQIRRHPVHRRDGSQPQRPRCRAELLAARHRSLRQGQRASPASKPSPHRRASARLLRRAGVLARHTWCALCARARSTLFRHTPAAGSNSAADVAARGEL